MFECLPARYSLLIQVGSRAQSDKDNLYPKEKLYCD